MTKLCFILGDQLCEELSSLQAINKNEDLVFMCEVAAETSYVPHHPKKIAFLFSAMRHFAQQLENKGYRVRYTKLNEPENQGNFCDELLRIISEEKIQTIYLTEPGEWRVLKLFEDLKNRLAIPLTICEDKRFLCSTQQFKQWAKNKKNLRMEFFYRMMRQQYQLLMDENNQPLGGSWNYDQLNRKNAKLIDGFPSRITHPQDEITQEVLALVEQQFTQHFGQLHPFNFAVTREQALVEAHYFIDYCLPAFGDYQDAMMDGEVSLYHSKLSFYLNAGLLLPMELCHLAEQAYRKKAVPLNSVEGFIRQILGWREYVRGIYWLNMPEYAEKNYLHASRDLPALFWGQQTKMHCMAEVVRQTAVAAYSHHIQRLMITGNFALLTGLEPKQVCAWYLAVYADAYEWVELPNTLGMALYADGGLMGSKPYAASGKYIHKMSNFCQSCAYNPNELLGEKACPFNSLYWNFIKEHEAQLSGNLRLRFAYLNWQKMPDTKKQQIVQKAQEVLTHLELDQL